MNWATIKRELRDIFKAIGKGELLLHLRVHKLLPYILYGFALACLSIFMSYKAEQTMLTMEKNKLTLDTLRVYHADKTCEIVSLDRISTVEKMLENLESEVQAPEKPANRIKR